MALAALGAVQIAHIGSASGISFFTVPGTTYNGFIQIVASHLNNLGLVRPSVDSLLESLELVAVLVAVPELVAVGQPILD